MTPEEWEERTKELDKVFPEFINKKCREFRKDPDSNNYPGKKITDYTILITEIWKISNKEYQERFWVRQERPLRGDNYMETMETFFGDAEGVLGSKRIEMTDKQREMLTKLYNMIDEFEDDPETPDDEGYGINDEAVVNDPKWDKVRKYAKLVYEEITGEKA